MSDWIAGSPEAQFHLRVANTILEQQGKINALTEAAERTRNRESVMVRHLLNWRDEADEGHALTIPNVRVDAQSVILAIGALILKCDKLDASSASLYEWLHDRVAAADLNRREPHGKVDVWVDVRSGARALDVLRYFVAHDLCSDPEVYELAALDFAAALAPIRMDDYRVAPYTGQTLP